VSIEYPLPETTTPYGPLLIPQIRLKVSTVHGWIPLRFLIDTGADFTMVPATLAPLVGVDLLQCPKEFVSGIEDRPLPVRVGSISICLDIEVIRVRCHFMKRENTPYLLGRMDLFSRFNIAFQNDQKRVSFMRIR
jgi:hypothetical protein